MAVGTQRLYSYRDLVELKGPFQALRSTPTSRAGRAQAIEYLREQPVPISRPRHLVLDGSQTVLVQTGARSSTSCRNGQGVLNIVALGS